MQKITKVESVADFLSRGGKITKVAAASAKVKRPYKQRVAQEAHAVDMTQLPMALQIKYGIR